MAKKVKISNTFHQWQTDSLAAASGTNRQIEGDDAHHFLFFDLPARIVNHRSKCIECGE